MTSAEDQIQRYLADLRKGLKGLPPAECEEILAEISVHLRESMQRPGEDIESVIARLGAAKDLAAQYRESVATPLEKPAISRRFRMSFDLWQDIKYGFRMLGKNPGFTAVAVMVLALAIGGNAAIFSLVNAFLLKPLRVHNPQELVGCYSRDTRRPDLYRAFSYPNYVDLRERNPVFASVAAHNLAAVGLADGDTTRHVSADVVSSNYFATLGAPLFKGRTFTSAEERPDSGAPVVIVSYSFWQKSGSDPELLGKTLRINGRTFAVIGIAGEGFTGTMALVSSELYLPLGTYSLVANEIEGRGRSLSERDNHVLILIGRLKPGLTDREANVQLAVVASQLERAFPAENRDQTFIVRPLSRLGVSTNPVDDREVRLPAILLMAMPAVVLLIASLNLANMMLARGATRRKEIAIRLAIGAGRSRIVRQLWMEGFTIAILGGAAGLPVAVWGSALLVRSFSFIIPSDLVYSSGPDIRVLAATMGFCLLSTIVFGLWPAWRLSHPDVLPDLKTGGGEDAGGVIRRLFSHRNVLVMAQLALSLMMLTAAGLFVRSAMRAARVKPGFSLENGVLVEVDPSLAGYNEVRGRQIYFNLLTRLKTVPGVESASLAWIVPFGNAHIIRGLRPAGSKAPGVAEVGAHFNIVTEDYFKTLDIPMLLGRSFLPGETAAGSSHHVAVIDKLAADAFWPNGDAIGKHVLLDDDELEVVGISGSVRDGIIGNPMRAHIYVPLGQQYRANMQIHLKVVAQGKEAQALMLQTIRREIRAVDDRLPVLTLKTLHDHLEGSFDLWVPRTGAQMLAAFGAVALFIAAIGLYGVKAYTVARRTREIGIRMAVGASSADALRLILGEGLVVTAIGVGGGLVLALAVGRILAGILYDVQSADLVVLATATALLTAVSMLATYLPARKAARVDPMVALRYD